MQSLGLRPSRRNLPSRKRGAGIDSGSPGSFPPTAFDTRNRRWPPHQGLDNFLNARILILRNLFGGAAPPARSAMDILWLLLTATPLTRLLPWRAAVALVRVQEAVGCTT